jgi:glycosyltransferase involved in cell wall biosynthesis
LEAFVQQGVSIDVFTIDHLGSLPKQEVIGGVNVYRVTSDARYYKNGIFGRRLVTMFRYAYDLRRHIRGAKYDNLLFTQFSLIPLVMSMLYGYPKSSLAVDFVEWRSSSLWQLLNSLIFGAVSKIICNTESNAQKVAALRNQSSSIYCVYSPVQLSKLRDVSDDYFAYVGRMERHKHPEHAILATLEYNRAFGRNERLVLVGDGGLYEDLKVKYTSKTIEFKGYITDHEKAMVLSRAKVLLVPSEREGLPEVVIEALACGVPTMTTDYQDNGTKDFIRGRRTGVVVAADIESMASGIKVLVDEYSQYKQRCIEQSPQFSVDAASRSYLDILDGKPRK